MSKKYEITKSEHSIVMEIFIAFSERLLYRSFVIFGACITIFRYFLNNDDSINNEKHVMTSLIFQSTISLSLKKLSFQNFWWRHWMWFVVWVLPNQKSWLRLCSAETYKWTTRATTALKKQLEKNLPKGFKHTAYELPIQALPIELEDTSSYFQNFCIHT